MKLCGITGGIGAGKSLAAQYLAAQGFPVLDADQVSRQISQPGGLAHAQLVAHFGTADAQELARLAFGSAPNRAELEKILHPLIRQESMRWFAEVARKTGANLAFYEAALLFEAGRVRDFEAVILITAPDTVRVSRVQQNRGLTAVQAHARIAAQWSDAQKCAEAQRLGVEFFIVENTGTLVELQRKLDTVLAQLVGSGARR